MVMCLFSRIVRMNVPMTLLRVHMRMLMNLNTTRAINGPDTNSYKQEAHQKLCPCRPGTDVDQAP